MIKMLDEVLKNEGLRGLVKGISATYYGSIYYGATYFFLYAKIKDYGHEHFIHSHRAPMLYFLSALLADMTALLVLYPFETIKVRFQTKHHHYQYKGVCDGLLHLLRHEGLEYIYKGYFPYALNYGINYSLQMTMYETIIRYLKEKHPVSYKAHEFYYVIQTSFVAGLIGSAFTNPLEVAVV